MKLYCKCCKFTNEMEYEPTYHNFICRGCDMLLIGRYGYQIYEYNDAGDLDLYVTKETFIFLMQNNFLKSLMHIYNNRVWISAEE